MQAVLRHVRFDGKYEISCSLNPSQWRSETRVVGFLGCRTRNIHSITIIVLFLAYHSSRKVCIGSKPRVCKGKLSWYLIILLTFSSVGWFVFVHCRTSFMSTCLRRQ